METYWCWLCGQKGIYRSHLQGLLQYFQTPRDIYEATDAELDRCGFLTPKQRQSLKNAKRDDNFWYALEAQGIQFISAGHPDFPQSLLDIPDCPYGLFYKGRLPQMGRQTAAMVGARGCSYYGRKMAEEIAAALVDLGVQIVSGMALGIDCHSQSAALSAGGDSFAVLGCGVDICYPSRNRELYRKLEEQGGILSEYPPGTQPLAHHFPVRNRLISGLSQVVLVIEAREKSGSLITADCALEQGKDVMAVPGRIGDPLSSGCNRLIAQGAGIILSVKDLLDLLEAPSGGIKNTKNNQIPLETKEKLVYSCLDLQPVSLEELILRTRLQAPEVMSILTSLLLKGYAQEPMKNYYAKS